MMKFPTEWKNKKSSKPPTRKPPSFPVFSPRFAKKKRLPAPTSQEPDGTQPGGDAMGRFGNLYNNLGDPSTALGISYDFIKHEISEISSIGY